TPPRRPGWRLTQRVPEPPALPSSSVGRLSSRRTRFQARARRQQGASASRETRQRKGPEMRAGELGGHLEEEGERIARLLGRENRIDKSACPGKLRIELMLVIGAHRLDGGRVVGLRGVGAIYGLDRRLSFHHA